MSWMKLTPRGSMPLALSTLAAANLAMMVMAEQPQAALADPNSNRQQDAPAVQEPGKQLENETTLAPGTFETLPNGYRRVHRSEQLILSPQQLAEWQAAGKADGLVGNARMMDTFTDHLPAGWGQHQAASGQRVDSYGNPIVNITAGVPDWAQRDVDALRNEVANTQLHVDNLLLALNGQAEAIAEVPPDHVIQDYARGAEDLQTDLYESQSLLGNFVGQAIARRIDVNDLIALDARTLPGETVTSIASYLHFYEGLKAHESIVRQEPYAPTSYPAQVTAMLAQAGYSMQSILALEPDGAQNHPLTQGGTGDEGGIAGTACTYMLFAFGTGMAALASPTVIWAGNVNPVDDASADVSIGFRHYFLPCEDTDSDFAMRVSSNGYITAFEQGGGALAGTVFTNPAIANTSDPDGFAAPWWDDLTVSNQGAVDTVSYKTEGSVGNRVFTVQYLSVSHFQGDTGDFHTFQMKVFEQSMQTQFHYSPVWLPDSQDSATAGIENFVGSDGVCAWICANNFGFIPDANWDFFFPQPANDNCVNAICVEEDELHFGHTFGAGGVDNTSCAFNDFADVWYLYRAPIAGTVTTSLCTGGNGYDSTIAVFNACNGAQLACNDDSCGLKAQVNFQATAGVNYLIRIAGFSGHRGTFGFNVDIGSQGDSCRNAWPISIPGTGVNFYSTFDNTGCDNESSCAGNDTIDEWLIWTAPSSGVARASTCAGSTDFDTTLSIFTGNCSTLTPLTQRACNDDASPFCFGELTSRVLWTVDAGEIYYIRVAGFGGATGEYDIALSYSTCPADIAPLDAGDGAVNVDDLIAVILGWGACDGCRADFAPPGGNNQVDVDDLIGVILGWGTCQ